MGKKESSTDMEFNHQDRQLIGRNLLEGQDDFGILFRSIDEGFCVIEVLFENGDRAVDYRVLAVNPAYVRHTGLVDAVGKRASELVPNLEKCWVERYGRIVITGRPVRFVDKSEAMGRWFDVRAFRLGDQTERTVGVIFSDISEEKRAEEELEQRSAHTSNALRIETEIRKRTEKLLSEEQNLFMALCSTSDLQTALDLCLDTALRLTNMDVGSIYLVNKLAGHIHRAAHRNLSEGFLSRSMTYDCTSPHFRLIQAGRPIYGPWTSLGLSREELPDQIRSVAIVPILHEGTAVACLNLGSWILDDIPESIRTAAETVATHVGAVLTRIQVAERYRRLFANATEGIFQTTPEGRFISANPALAHLLGYSSPEELMVQITNLGKQVILDPAVRPAYLRILHKTGVLRGYECEMRKADGTIIWGSINARAVRDEIGNILYYEGTFQDVTQRKLASEHLSIQRDLALQLAHISDIYQGLALILKTALELSGMESGGIYLSNEQNGAFELCSSVGLSENFVQKAARLEVGSPDWSFIMGGKEVYGATHKEETPLTYEEGFEYGAIIPIQRHDQIIGSINIESRYRDHIPERAQISLGFLSAEVGNIIARMQARQRLEREMETRIETEKTLQETNAALRILLRQREVDRKELEDRLVSNIQQLVLPYVEKLKKCKSETQHHTVLGLLETNLNDIVSPFLTNVQRFNLTPRQIEIVALIKAGRTTKEIAETLHITKAAIDKQRSLIRERLNLRNDKTNLRSYLLSLV